MKNVVSASRRTDIPAYYWDWFLSRIESGCVEVTNPFNRTQVKRVSLKPEDVAWIILWSRNFHSFLKSHQKLRDYQLFFHFTILPHTFLEKSVIPIANAVKQVQQLVDLFGVDRIIWRYDPMVLWSENGVTKSNHDITQFEYLAKTFSTFGLDKCFFSFAHPYSKFINRFKSKYPLLQIYTPGFDEKQTILNDMLEIGRSSGITFYSCCNDSLLNVAGIKKGSCIDGRFLNNLSSEHKVSIAKTALRPDCGCTKSIDIGDYLTQPCPSGCIYCYANPVWK